MIDLVVRNHILKFLPPSHCLPPAGKTRQRKGNISPIGKGGRGFEYDILHEFKDSNNRWAIMKSKSLVLVFLFLFLFISPSFSQPPEKRYGPGRGRMHRRGESPCPRASDLNLSSDQMKELELIQQSFYREAYPIRTELFSKYLELKEFLTDPIIKTDSIHAKNAEIILLQSKLEERTIQYLIKVRTLLTQEQLRIWCPEQEFPYSRRMMPGPGPMGPMSPPKAYPQEAPRKE
jgi:hypothetical protein